MNRFIPAMIAFAAIALISGCASETRLDPELQTIDQGQLPVANVTLDIPGLGPCTDNPDRSLHLNSQQSVNVMVHGCFGSSGLFRGLAQVLAFHGQQTACFTYNDRDSMLLSSAQLNSALDQLAQKMDNKHVTVIGHSQGALIARKALTADRPDPIHNDDLKLRLVTVSGPFAGIASANQCTNPIMRVLTFGLIGPLCKIVTGDKWSEITYRSAFILQPGMLHKQVENYLKVVTDERGTCRRTKDGICQESDEIFSLEEQANAIIDRDPIVKIAVVKAGHVEIVGDKRVAPVKLIAILQENGVINPTEPERTQKLSLLLTKLYGEAN
jgi:pimeloyl-ACP methyl ester carboxylesterase